MKRHVSFGAVAGSAAPRSPPRRHAPDDLDDLLVGAPGRNNVAVIIHTITLFSTWFPSRLQLALARSKGCRAKAELWVRVIGKDEITPATVFAMSSWAPGAWSMRPFRCAVVRRSIPQGWAIKRG